MEDLKPYIVEFELDKARKPKIYPNNYIVKSSNWGLIIIITYDKYTFSVNDSIWQA